MTDNSIPFEEYYEEAQKGEWTEQVNVAGGKLVETIQSLMHEAAIRKITIVDKNGRVLLELPLYAGVAGVFILGAWSALALIAAWFAEVSILIVREDMPEIDEDAETAVHDAMSGAAAGLNNMAAQFSRAMGDLARRAADVVEGGVATNGNGATKSAKEAKADAEAEVATCAAFTKSGKPCKNKAQEGSEFCGVHQQK